MVAVIKITNVTQNPGSWSKNHIGKVFKVVKCAHKPFGGDEPWWRLLEEFEDKFSLSGAHRGFLSECSFEFIDRIKPIKYVTKHSMSFNPVPLYENR